MHKDYQLALLCFIHLLVSADGVVDNCENDAIKTIKEREGIGESICKDFEKLISHKKESEIYEYGISLINRCTDQEKLKIFVTLYKLSEVDGRVHVKEIRLLLFSIKLTGIAFNDVVNQAMATPALIQV